jgi:DNA-binding transcriptional ArsR family regulator
MNETSEKSTALDKDLKVDFLQLKKAALILRAINHKLRQQILKLIQQKDKITVTEIYVKLRLEQSCCFPAPCHFAQSRFCNHLFAMASLFTTR